MMTYWGLLAKTNFVMTIYSSNLLSIFLPGTFPLLPAGTYMQQAYLPVVWPFIWQLYPGGQELIVNGLQV